jgi:acyl-CoA thioester hydrolase
VSEKLTQVRPRSDFAAFEAVDTRWEDNDAYGHVNNVVYYSFFDTAVNRYLIEHGGLNVLDSPEIGLVVETHCHYFSSIAFPATVEVGLKVVHIGRSSVKYELGIFKGDQDLCSAWGHFVHVYVNRLTQKTVNIPNKVREILQKLV